MPTLIPSDILKLCDSHGKEVTNFEWIDPENPRLLISPEIGGVYEAVVFLKNTHPEFRVLHVRLSHNYQDIKIEPSYIESLKSQKSVKIRLIWKPFTKKGISEKIKDNKVFVNIENSCMVEVVSEIPEEV